MRFNFIFKTPPPPSPAQTLGRDSRIKRTGMVVEKLYFNFQKAETFTKILTG